MEKIVYFGVYHDVDVDHGMVDYLIKVVNEGRKYKHEVSAYFE